MKNNCNSFAPISKNKNLKEMKKAVYLQYFVARGVLETF